MLGARQIHIISLPREMRRRKVVSELFESRGIPYSFFDAIHGKESFGGGNWPWFYDPELFKAKNHGVTLSLGDLGCAASHITLWERLSQSNDSAWVIFEDDICLDSRVDLECLEEIVLDNKGNEVTLLNHYGIFGFRAGRRRYARLKAEARFPIWQTNGAGAYVIGRGAAVALLDFIRERHLIFPTDMWGSLKHGQRGFSQVIPIRVVLPPPAWQDPALPSAITEMGRPDIRLHELNQSGRVSWRLDKSLPKTGWFWIRGHIESWLPPKNLPLAPDDVRF